jgi:membrane dipeptidase
LYALQKNGGSLARNAGHFDLTRGAAFAPAARFFAVYGFPFGVLYPLFAKNAAACQDRIALCRTASEARATAAAGQLAAFLSLEGAEAVGLSEGGLEDAWRQGARMVSLTWNHDNPLAGGASGDGRGLSEAGRAFLRRAKALPMVVDVSHASDRTFWDIAEEMGGTPFVASHSNARVVCPHRRNLTDDQADALIRANGFIGLNLYAGFLARGRQAVLSDALAHLEHFLSRGGAGQVGLGCDLDGCDDLPEGMSGVQDMEALYELLLRENYPEALVRDIFYNNLIRVVETVCGM